MHIKLFNNGFYTILQFRLQNYNKNCTYASVRVFFRKKIELFYYFMHGDGFGCLHTEDISGHKIEGLPFLRKNTRRCTYAPQDAAVNSKGSP